MGSGHEGGSKGRQKGGDVKTRAGSLPAYDIGG
jgi:hypothetical protein